ncbi:hypothetical protein K490DRAFT_40095 [Saccharata proteae CBS 121410]|uniref:BHLH domain-containing protein n=1 Tax=Saccharata proteae CBS 121410 TaxID=1314787 RepID=A0A9P4HXL4_9PEZI|nr:hypothetical protein K490DRAFT_40095 [Saccharata proteae CBS 121410]
MQPRQAPPDARDSGNWTLSQTHSKHSSGVSNSAGLQLQSILNTDDSPHRHSIPETPSSVRFSALNNNALPSFNHGFDNRASLDVNSAHLDSRRSSIDSRMNAGMGHLAISPSSPYESQNASRVSLVSNLAQQRGIAPDQRQNGGPQSPLGPHRNSQRASQPPRRAPVINPNPRSVSGMPDPMASAPTKGFPWAFPDHPDDERRGSSSGDSSVERSLPSRQNSFATSINSSIYTADSIMPPGQKRFDEGKKNCIPPEVHAADSNSDIPHTHHHSIQHRNVTDLRTEHTPPAGTGNYSRTPELRVSHKMAERKRRSEMKSLFDELNAILPNSPGNKSSKWEILTKGKSHERVVSDGARLRQEVAATSARDSDMVRENAELRHELHATWAQLRQLDPNHHHVYGAMTGFLANQQAQSGNGQPPTLPPLQPTNGQWAPGVHPPPQPTAMQGVEFAGGRPYSQR